jgi:HSP20 family protein
MNTETAVSKTQKPNDDTVMVPPVDVVEDAQGITLYADLPGLAKENLSMQVEADTLTIEGQMSLAVPENMQAKHVEVGVPRYRRVFTISKDLDCEKISAEFKQGVLKLHIPKAVHLQPRKIAITAE